MAIYFVDLVIETGDFPSFFDAFGMFTRGYIPMKGGMSSIH